MEKNKNITPLGQLQKGISVIICCYNSAWVISRTLEGLKKQIIPQELKWEIVLVDNCCTDDTAKIATNTMNDSNIIYRIVFEETPGLANARRRGIDAVKYDTVIYCDDDNILCPNYVSTMYNIMQNDMTIAAAGGKGIAEFQCTPESDVLKNITGYAIGSQLEHKDWLFGAGVCLRTTLVKEVYYTQKCYLMGRKGKELLSGDDSELVMSMANRGYKIHPTDEIYYTHVLKANRLTNDYCKQLLEGFVLPSYVFRVMRAAMYNTGFNEILNEHIKLYKQLFKYSIVRWKPWSEIQRNIANKELQRWNYWGIFKLYCIYRDWRKINRMYQGDKKE